MNSVFDLSYLIISFPFFIGLQSRICAEKNWQQELIRRWDSERELFLQHRTCRGQRLRPL